MRRREFSPRLRFWLLQGTLCITFLATLVLARAVQRLHQPSAPLQLTPLADVGTLKLRMLAPEGWSVQRSREGVTLNEIGPSERRRRRLRVWHQHGTIFMSPLEFLVRSGELSTSEAAALLLAKGRTNEPARLATIMMAGSSGVVVSQTRTVRGMRGQDAAVRVETVAATVLPTGDALLMRLVGEGTDPDDDLDTLEQIAATLELPDAIRPRYGGRIELGSGMTLSIPSVLTSAPVRDPLRTGAPLVLANENLWMAVDVAQCPMVPGEGLEALPVRLAVRDPLYKPGPVMQLDPNTVACERQLSPTDSTAGLFPAITYLHTDAHGRGVLMEFRWNATAVQADAARELAQSLWKALRLGLAFDNEPQLAELFKAGQVERQSLPRDASQLLSLEGAGADRWQWYHEALARPSWVTITHLIDATHLRGVYEAEESPPLSGVGHEMRQWALSRDGARYDNKLTRILSTGGMTHELTVRDDEIAVKTTGGRQGSLTKSATVSSAYIPGGILPLALGRFQSRPLLMQTDLLPNPIGWVATGPVPILLTPMPDGARNMDDEPLRCWRIEVSGSGRASLWYMRPSGLLQSIDFAGRVHLQRAPELPATRPTTQPATQPATHPAPVPGERPQELHVPLDVEE